ncbi:hypothetical protein PH213_07530 [Streptomyces sp. SRF1]|uniref:hypothetical protein n=1 Tax=Streptomyces sp. SRF1 TaxID=1549642 RepID=UPI0025B153D6|nr:hypothetical protein [Streptomyces sp. SRF1]MDN3054390.1 hypothetical protein [Streptomyces sp. SRF1]
MAVAVVGAAAVAMTGCEPADDGLSSVTVAVTTDQVATRALERGGVGVLWMSCNAEFRNGRTVGASPSRGSGRTRAGEPAGEDGRAREGVRVRESVRTRATERRERAQATDARVHCRGRTENHKDIRISGRVTYVRENHCVRGDLTGQVDGRKVFEAKVIGECQGRALDTEREPETESPRPTRSHPWDHRTTDSGAHPGGDGSGAPPDGVGSGVGPGGGGSGATPGGDAGGTAPGGDGTAPGGAGSGATPSGAGSGVGPGRGGHSSVPGGVERSAGPDVTYGGGQGG